MRFPIKPMLAEPAVTPTGDRYPHHFDRDDWAFEIKWDGYRAIAVRGSGRPTIYSRPGRVVTSDWPEIAAMLPQNAVLDGEIIMVRNGQSSFNALQLAKRASKSDRIANLRYVVFDILQVDDNDIQHYEWSQRREILQTLLAGNDTVTMSFEAGSGREAWGLVQEHRLEGLIAKPRRSRYVQGNRGIWLKHKRNVIETFEVVGYTNGEGRNAGHFGALVLATRVGDRLVYSGKCGTGFDQRKLASVMLMLTSRATRQPSVDAQQRSIVEQHLGQRSVTWVKEGLRATVEFNDYTDQRIVRMASFRSLEEADA